MRRKIEFHILKNYAFSNLNRDEFGTPKSFVFAGHPHGRISSQCLKRSWREYFRENFDEKMSYKTRALPNLVKEKLVEMGESEIADEVAEAIKETFGKESKEENITAQVLAITDAEVEHFAELFNGKTSKEIKDVLKGKNLFEVVEEHGTAVDVALWGRLMTSPVLKSKEAAMQVAHAVSTNESFVEQDFFSVVDDIIEDGAGMIGVAEYNSNCYYEYACLDFDLLADNLKSEDKAKDVLPALLKSMVFSNPSGKTKGTATNELPFAVMVETKEVPYSLVNAYATPCNGEGDGLLINSQKALVERCESMNSAYGFEAKRLWFSVDGIPCECAESVNSLSELVGRLNEFV